MRSYIIHISILIATLLGCATEATGQRVSPRAEFISYDVREDAYNRDLPKNNYYLELEMKQPLNKNRWMVETTIDIPYTWLDRELFIQVIGVPSYRVKVNGVDVGEGDDSQTPTQFNISNYVNDGSNIITLLPLQENIISLEVAAKARTNASIKAILFSQPKVHINDFKMRLVPDSTGKFSLFEIEVVVANSYNLDENIRIGYDIFSPDGELMQFDYKDIAIKGRGMDTIRFSTSIWRTAGNLWSAESPKLYYGSLSIRRGGRFEEYVAYKIGAGSTTIESGNIVRNGKAVDIKAARYSVSGDEQSVKKDIIALKKGGINTIIPHYPQPIWFYDLCDEVGIYIIEQANINSDFDTSNRKIGGAVSNNPNWLPDFLSRIESMYARVHNHSSIIGWSLGAEVGNGYNMYRSYLRLKELDAERAVIYNDAQGEWNSDMEPIEAVDAQTIIGAKAAVAKNK